MSNGMYDATCPKCGCRVAWKGRVFDRPRCPRCGHQIPQGELAAADQQLEKIRQEMLADSNRTPHLFTVAEIFQAQALGCQPEQLLPQGKTCGDCAQRSACAFVLEDDFEPTNHHCQFSPNRFQDSWRSRIGRAH